MDSLPGHNTIIPLHGTSGKWPLRIQITLRANATRKLLRFIETSYPGDSASS